MAQDDGDLVRRCLSGDEAAMRALVESYQGVVFGICYRMLSHRQDAEDAAQEVFLRAFRSLHRWDGCRPLRPWLLTIAVNRCRTFRQQRARRPVASDASVRDHADDEREAVGELGEELQLALTRLRDEYRTCFILFHQQELSCAEIGEILGCPSGTVKTWLHRARRELAEHLQRRGVMPDVRLELHRV